MARAPRKPTAEPPHEPALPRDARRARGVYFTPPEVARLLAERILAAWRPRGSEAPRVLDLACGAGALLLAVATEWRREERVGPRLFGIDRDAHAISDAHRELAPFVPELQVVDGLFAEPGPRASFDIVVGNPPYINIRQAARNGDAGDQGRLSRRFRCARGSYDLYVLFCERAWELLAPGGVLGFIVPDKFGSAEYARPFRRQLLDEATILEIWDLGEEGVFRRASVYPWMLVARKQTAASTHKTRFIRRDEGGRIFDAHCPQGRLSADAFALDSSLQWDGRTATAPLGSRATLACGATGYRAQRLAKLLCEASDAAPGMKMRPFIVTGNIDPFTVKPIPVRYQRRLYHHPVLDEEAGMSSHQRALFARPKLVIAGLAQRIEAAWDDLGRALGVQVFAAYDFADDPFYVLGLLNSELLSRIFRQQFAARRMAGGYLTFNKGPLSKLPIRLLEAASSTDRRNARILTSAARELHFLGTHHPAAFQAKLPELTSEINAAALALYRITEREFADDGVNLRSRAA